MKMIIIAYSMEGGALARKLRQKLGKEIEISPFLFQKYQMEDLLPFSKADRMIENAFQNQIPLLFISSTGIAVRKIAPYLQSKVTDPPVIVMDDAGRHVISLLSGHLGGANELTIRIARCLGAEPVITTSTDNHGLFAVDVFAKKNNLVITDMKAAKNISAAVVNKEQVTVWADENFCRWKNREGGAESAVDIFEETPETKVQFETIKKNIPFPELIFCQEENELKAPSIAISPKLLPIKNKNQLQLIPKCIVIGIGCRRNTEPADIWEAVQEIFLEKQIDLRAVRAICSIDLKKEETGICQLADRLKVPFYTFSSEKLQTVEGDFSSSEFVSKITGVDNVCERSIAAFGGTVFEKKMVRRHVTVALGQVIEEMIWK